MNVSRPSGDFTTELWPGPETWFVRLRIGFSGDFVHGPSGDWLVANPTAYSGSLNTRAEYISTYVSSNLNTYGPSFQPLPSHFWLGFVQSVGLAPGAIEIRSSPSGSTYRSL